MGRIPKISTKEELYEIIDEIGFIPFFSGGLEGFSVMDITSPCWWWSDDPVRDPWAWRIQIAAEGRVAYGKFFRGKAGFISREWFPVFANYRRDGYDFDSLYEEGKAKHREKLIMDLFSDFEKLPGFEIKRLAGFGKGGEKGYEGAVTSLQMQTYLTICEFKRKQNKRGGEYGWPVSVLSCPETVFGEELVRSLYNEEPEKSFEKIVYRCGLYAPMSYDEEIRKFLK